MTKRNILIHISGNQYPPFPTMHSTAKIWEELSLNFDEYHVFARSKNWTFSSSKKDKVTLHLIPSITPRMFEFFFTSWILIFYVVKIRPSIMLAQCPVLGGLSGALCSAIFGIPLLVELHGTHYFAPKSPGFFSKMEHYLYRILSPIAFGRACRIRSLSDSMTGWVSQIYGNYLQSKIQVIPNRVNLEIFQYAKKTYDLAKSIRIISVGSFSHLKNYANLISDLSKLNHPFHLTLIGHGSNKSEYNRIASELGIQDSLTIRENLTHTEIAELLVKNDVYIQYSLSEGVPRAILEAMSEGLPVITTNVGYIQGILLDHENAIVIEKPYAANLKTALNELIKSVELRTTIGTKARETIQTNFDWNHVFNLYRNQFIGGAPL